ncbi:MULTISPECIES: hypothetical protein [unclassified Moorena]|uniref:hypothetical protein n=1 Tax=unclassified Moorena TaxID=2683338 RepID=UPI0013B7A7DF|nr:MULTISPECIES: hypothetical protein [unclassified Moorena]NEP31195.1 hypothetical protein [Moorena sp. SIO3B2]NEQ06970.1 hypothetical protein [Moorena sp. SIO4E2]NET67830.1 hypothetical protein [Moorena sp. SIO1G6]
MKIKYFATIAAASIVTLGLVTSCGAPTTNTTPGESTTEQGNPCAGKSNPCASKKNPCASKKNP